MVRSKIYTRNMSGKRGKNKKLEVADNTGDQKTKKVRESSQLQGL